MLSVIIAQSMRSAQNRRGLGVGWAAAPEEIAGRDLAGVLITHVDDTRVHT